VDRGDIREAYRDAASRFDRAMATAEWLGGGRLRSDLLSRAWGRVFEVAVGTGASFGHYPDACRLVGGDPTEAMLRRARPKAYGSGRTVHLAVMDAECLPVPDAAFDTVVETRRTFFGVFHLMKLRPAAG
jgi:ubiquinone/menaquinone biosynthesis C-methylase UbiE